MKKRSVVFAAFVVGAALLLKQFAFAAMIEAIVIAMVHCHEETSGRLWVYFGKVSGFEALMKLDDVVGFLLIVFPALILQMVSAWMAFHGPDISPFWLSLLIFGRLSDAVNSHIGLRARGYEPVDQMFCWQMPTQLNPGLSSAYWYVADSFVFLFFFGHALGQYSAIVGGLMGFFFFFLVVPILTELGKFADRHAKK